MKSVLGALPGFFGRLRSPMLFSLVAGLFLLDVIVPDFIPFIDEILLAGATVMLARWRKPELTTVEPNQRR